MSYSLSLSLFLDTRDSRCIMLVSMKLRTCTDFSLYFSIFMKRFFSHKHVIILISLLGKFSLRSRTVHVVFQYISGLFIMGLSHFNFLL